MQITVTGQRRLEIDSDIQLVIEFMESTVQASKLVSVADNLPQLARLLWGQFPPEPCSPALLVLPKPECSQSLSYKRLSFGPAGGES
jgi:hypothetical protein